MKKQCMVLLVENNAGVLARISSLFMQRGFNIDSLTVSSTENPEISRITIMATGDQKTFTQIMRQTGKLVETKKIFSVEPSSALIRELLLVKISVSDSEAESLKSIISNYGASILDMTSGCLVAELAAFSSDIDDFIEAISSFKMLEMCRSGAIAMERGKGLYDAK